MTDVDPSLTGQETEQLLAEAFQRFEEGGDEAVDQFCQEHPDREAMIRRAIGLLQDRGLATTTPRGLAQPERLGDYKVIRRLGGGGMGVVYLAHDEKLQREVALKVVRPDQLYFPGARERFRREVETIANLRHTGIVPLYDVGEEDGLPYYVMELVRGRTLAEVIASLQGRDASELSGADLVAALASTKDDAANERVAQAFFHGAWEEVCLRIVREVGEALEHAHRRGIVHRDVKPSNVMLTPAGRVLLLDFGLSSQRGGTRITRSGSPVGSLAYMAPEMLRGESADEDGRLDVWSLGITLYELLSLKLPFPADSEARLRAAVLRGDMPGLRSRNPRASWEAETICQVATDPDPRRRYESPQAFVRDVSNALAARPLEARRPGPWLRARRWMQRHPVTAAITAALVVGPSLFAWQELENAQVVLAKNNQIQRANDDLRVALEAAESARASSEENFKKALEAVGRMLTRVGDETLATVPRMGSVRRELLLDALEFHEWFLARAGNDPALRAESARVAVRTANLLAATGDPEEADAALARAEEILRMSEGPDVDAEVRFALADLLYRRAVTARLLGQAEVARERLVEAGEVALSIDAHEESPAQLTSIASHLGESAQLDLEAGRLDEAEESLQRAAALYESLVAGGHATVETRHDLALVYDRLGLCAMDQSRSDLGATDPEALERSLEYVETAIDYAAELAAELPDDPRMPFRLARALLNRSATLASLDRYAKADESVLEAIAILEVLVADFPSTAIYMRDLAGAYGNAAVIANNLGRNEEALDYARRAVDAFRELGGDTSRDLFYLTGFCSSLFNLAEALARNGEIDAPLALTDEMLDRLARARQNLPPNPILLFQTLSALQLQAHLLVNTNRLDEAAERILALISRAQEEAQLEQACALAARCLRKTRAATDSPAAVDARVDERAERFGRALSTSLARGLSSADALRTEETEALWSVPAFEAALVRQD